MPIDGALGSRDQCPDYAERVGRGEAFCGGGQLTEYLRIRLPRYEHRQTARGRIIDAIAIPE